MKNKAEKPNPRIYENEQTSAGLNHVDQSTSSERLCTPSAKRQHKSNNKSGPKKLGGRGAAPHAETFTETRRKNWIPERAEQTQIKEVDKKVALQIEIPFALKADLVRQQMIENVEQFLNQQH